MVDVAESPGFPKGAIVWAVVRRPSLWWTAIRQLGRMTPEGWWRTKPFLPVPPTEYLEFRLVTQYGGGHGRSRPDIEVADVVDYLRWCKAWNDGR